MSSTQLLSLVEYMAYKVGCAYINDLPRLDALGRMKAAHALESDGSVFARPVERRPAIYRPGTGGAYRSRSPFRPDG